MEVKTFEGKNLEELLVSSLEELNLTSDDVLYTHEETKGGLLKKGGVKLNIYTLTDIQNYVKEYLSELTKLMGLDVTFETKRRDSQICVKMYSNNNSILIGKDGKTREIIMEMAEVHMAVYGKTVSLIGEMDNIMIAKEAIEMILNGSRHKSVYGFLEHKKEDLKRKEFNELVGIEEDKIEFKDGIDFDEKDY